MTHFVNMKITIQADFGRIILQMEGSSWDLYSPYVFVFRTLAVRYCQTRHKRA